MDEAMGVAMEVDEDHVSESEYAPGGDDSDYSDDYSDEFLDGDLEMD